MAKIEINKVELVWPGKYNEDGTLKEVPRVSLPFQVIERVNESRATKEAEKQLQEKAPLLYQVWGKKEGDTFEEGWRNKLIWGDNLYVMGSLLEHFAGKIDLIYIDPPFATGADFRIDVEIGTRENLEVISKEQSIIEEKAYRDTWGKGLSSYLGMLYPRFMLMKELLRDGGSLFVHTDYRVNSHVRLLLDEIFGRSSLVNEIAWCYGGGGAPRNFYPRKHDTILWYTKGDNWTFHKQFRPYSESTKRTGFRAKGIEGYELDPRGAGLTDWWPDCPKILSYNAAENWKYPTQKPESLLQRIIVGHSDEGDLVADFFCGSGTTLAVAEKLNRRWIGCDLSRWAIHVTRKRLLDIEGCKPFEVLNLGKYERQYWSSVTFGDKKDKSRAEQVLYEYLAFILKLYGAQPVAGMAHLHGKKGKAMVHIGAVDAPVTIDEINAAIEECVKIGQKELHVLGWEWEMGLAGPNNDVRRGSPMHEIARQKGVKLVLLQIPREVMEEQAVKNGDVKFFELAYFEVVIHKEGCTVKLELKDFASPNMDELIPEEVRAKIKKWSDYIDYWAIDWDFRNDSFMQGWVAYRTRKNRKLPLVSDPHTYEKPGKYRILVKVIDIFGNDTSQAYEVEVE